MIIAVIFNFSHQDSLILTFILIPIALIFYLFLDDKLSKITDYSYTKGWFDGYKRNLRGYGKSYDDGHSDGSNFKN
ncbi:hypothetical protein NAT51_10095 [Flavobacterium amniphilum]|uniref:hypothetical protein n=1 Tax=Flavobacterium amniphilum TaxID=1834035 RepID=UPI00202A034E|nr:hypothetical protein [Flavobacterium amniphilum]MCL9805874.1 hypothetical protein [Flavobacterium amniphilum]